MAKLTEPLDLKSVISENGAIFSLYDSDLLARDDYFRPSQVSVEDSEIRLRLEEKGEDGIIAEMFNVTGDEKVKKAFILEGSGALCQPPAKVTIHYSGFIFHQDEPFSTTRNGRPEVCSFDCLFPGMQVAVASMKKKEKSMFYFHYDYAFGKLGAPPRIPAETNLIYVVELIDICADNDADFFSLTHEEKVCVSFDVLQDAVREAKLDASNLFKTGKFRQAAKKYRQMLTVLEDYHINNDREEIKVDALKYRFYLNLALCANRLVEPEKTLKNCNDAAHLARERVDDESGRLRSKIHYLKGKAFHQLQQFDDSRREFLAALKLRPTNTEVASELASLEKSIARFSLTEQNFCKKAFTGAGAESECDKSKLNQTGADVVSSKTPIEDDQKEAIKPSEASEEADLAEIDIIDNATFHEIVFDMLHRFQTDEERCELPIGSFLRDPSQEAIVRKIATQFGLTCINKAHGLFVAKKPVV